MRSPRALPDAGPDGGAAPRLGPDVRRRAVRIEGAPVEAPVAGVAVEPEPWIVRNDLLRDSLHGSHGAVQVDEPLAAVAHLGDEEEVFTRAADVQVDAQRNLVGHVGRGLV